MPNGRNAAAAVAFCGFIVGCASASAPTPITTGGSTPDGGVGGGGGGVDMSVALDQAMPMTPPPDMAGPNLGFGDTCGNDKDCASNICVFTGVGGVCTRLCNNDCPPGYGCYAVVDDIDGVRYLC